MTSFVTSSHTWKDDTVFAFSRHTRWCGPYRIGLGWDHVEVCYVEGDETPWAMKGRKFIDRHRDYQRLKKEPVT